MILRLRHVMSCACDSPGAPAAYLLHMRPRALASQRVLDFALTATPPPSRQLDGADHFGNPVTWIFHDEPHTRFEIASAATIELLPRLAPAFSPPWEEVADAARNQAWAWREAEFMFPSQFVPTLPEARQFAAPSFPPGRPIADAAACLVRRIGQAFGAQPANTAGPTPLAHPVAQSVGAVQELTQAVIAGLRGFGLPGRYMCGYLLKHGSPGDRLHAWVGCWLGPGLGWLDLDPAQSSTNGQDHVCVGWGRDHGDVSPMRGVVFGEGRHVVHTSVSHDTAEAQTGK